MTHELGSVAFAEGRGCLSAVPEILEDMRNGRMVVLVDAEERENEGDLIIPAQMATPDAINFMAKHGRGLICLALTQARAHELGLEAMVRRNDSRNRTAFTQSIEAREGITTGISAHDRARTIATAIDPTKGADDIVSPGHVFPLVAREGGVLIRAGHTEASVDLTRLAGLYPAAVICEIMNDDGTMARMPDLVAFAQAPRPQDRRDRGPDRLPARRTSTWCAPSPRPRSRRPRPAPSNCTSTRRRWSRASIWRSSRATSRAPGPVLVRVHAVNALGDLLGVGEAGEGGRQIENAMRAIDKEGRGVIVLIRDLRPKSVSEWIERRTQRPQEGRRRALSAGRSRSASARRSSPTSASTTWCC